MRKCRLVIVGFNDGIEFREHPLVEKISDVKPVMVMEEAALYNASTQHESEMISRKSNIPSLTLILKLNISSHQLVWQVWLLLCSQRDSRRSVK